MKILVGCILMMAISAWIPLSIASIVAGKLTMEAAAIANGNAVASVNGKEIDEEILFSG